MLTLKAHASRSRHTIGAPYTAAARLVLGGLQHEYFLGMQLDRFLRIAPDETTPKSKICGQRFSS
jgi:hypothetical protein